MSHIWCQIYSLILGGSEVELQPPIQGLVLHWIQLFSVTSSTHMLSIWREWVELFHTFLMVNGILLSTVFDGEILYIPLAELASVQHAYNMSMMKINWCIQYKAWSKRWQFMHDTDKHMRWHWSFGTCQGQKLIAPIKQNHQTNVANRYGIIAPFNSTCKRR